MEEAVGSIQEANKKSREGPPKGKNSGDSTHLLKRGDALEETSKNPPPAKGRAQRHHQCTIKVKDGYEYRNKGTELIVYGVGLES